ncbi:Uncharacterised protein [Salmonella enterica subsp. enterica serovar Bovismorbificans]|uniref:Uncharacterized protein n=1 Tax=Salmonella enterica subsp. enterica serovar Bovismorbificans TaxID=58097 RepID=A0A655E1E5_SALET|nr:Uncharacterised protein [Salmonella enterica subsp. enterica serovar Bovismorbificans]CNU07505.1 Uncharacterised protein [Salmonella enterica subsp. enterica serovar Bovismorbificans]CNU23279.1 Uncharacterised protein [Salmonella enterica subsp. enterica serovar Bovismorbificans]CNU26039.1 Uncharacterised protein [Salmonella enterica subsp. enterica serovar Bovismorbificans]CNU98481.1 Uncharacterised protein [Salmonella enterica subsp. enterica serovar Bovismorbificans]
MVITTVDSVWCAKPPILINAMATYGLVVMLTKPIEIIKIAPMVKLQRRALIVVMCIFSMKNFARKPPATQPKSAARNGSQANMAISFNGRCITLIRYSGIQKLSVPHAGSARKRVIANAQKLRFLTISLTAGFLLSSWR